MVAGGNQAGRRLGWGHLSPRRPLGPGAAQRGALRSISTKVMAAWPERRSAATLPGSEARLGVGSDTRGLLTSPRCDLPAGREWPVTRAWGGVERERWAETLGRVSGREQQDD